MIIIINKLTIFNRSSQCNRKHTLKVEEEMVKMRILLTNVNPKLKSALVMLVDLQQKRVLPIRIGIMEGLAIVLGIEKEITPCPTM